MNASRQIQLAIDNESAASREATRDVRQAVDRIIDQAEDHHHDENDALLAFFVALGNSSSSQPWSVISSGQGSGTAGVSSSTPATYFVPQSHYGSSTTSQVPATLDWGHSEIWTPLGQMGIPSL
jgi:hypothetical protein